MVSFSLSLSVCVSLLFFLLWIRVLFFLVSFISMFLLQRIQSPSRKIARTSSEEKESVSPPPVMQEPGPSLTEAKVAPVSPAPVKEEPQRSLRVNTGFLWDQTPQASEIKDEEEDEEEEMEVCAFCCCCFLIIVGQLCGCAVCVCMHAWCCSVK